MESKVVIRKRIREKREALNGAEKAVFDQKIIANLLPLIKGCSNVAIFYPTEVEVNLLAIAQEKYKILVPKIMQDKSLRFYSIDEELILHPKYKIMEPTGTSEITPDAIICPLLAFDKNKNRLGYGGGYYDRTLPLFPQAKKIGVAYSFQELPTIPTEPHDQLLHNMVTEQKTF